MARLAVVAVLALCAGQAASASAPHASALHAFSYRGAGTNSVNIATGEVREVWTAKSKVLGRISAHVVGWIERPNPTDLTFRGTMVIADAAENVLIGSCTGAGVLPNPDGHEDWTCEAVGGTGKFRRSKGQWKLHIEISRISNANGVQKNRFTEAGSGKISFR